ncbi:hypothetical protein [Alkalibacterium sp. 20]|nr:hypothetical protein [Alkalibacterium sp. 20]
MDTRERRGVRDRIFTAILDQFKEVGDRIELASETFEIVHQEKGK